MTYKKHKSKDRSFGYDFLDSRLYSISIRPHKILILCCFLSAYLHKANLTLRKALAYLDASIAVGLLVENWSAYPLSKPTIEINEGKVVQENTTIPVPGSVKAGTMNAGIVLQSKVKCL